MSINFMSYLKLAVQENVLADKAEGYKNLDKSQLLGFLESFIDWILLIVAIVAVAMAIYAGYILITARDDEKKPAMAKKMLLYSVLGVIVVLLSKAIISFSVSFLE